MTALAKNTPRTRVGDGRRFIDPVADHGVQLFSLHTAQLPNFLQRMRHQEAAEVLRLLVSTVLTDKLAKVVQLLLQVLQRMASVQAAEV